VVTTKSKKKRRKLGAKKNRCCLRLHHFTIVFVPTRDKIFEKNRCRITRMSANIPMHIWTPSMMHRPECVEHRWSLFGCKIIAWKVYKMYGSIYISTASASGATTAWAT
jgi:hypothetical protein